MDPAGQDNGQRGGFSSGFGFSSGSRLSPSVVRTKKGAQDRGSSKIVYLSFQSDKVSIFEHPLSCAQQVDVHLSSRRRGSPVLSREPAFSRPTLPSACSHLFLSDNKKTDAWAERCHDGQRALTSCALEWPSEHLLPYASGIRYGFRYCFLGFVVWSVSIIRLIWLIAIVNTR